MQLSPYYQCVGQFQYGIDNANAPACFYHACEDLARCLADGTEAQVWHVTPPTVSEDGEQICGITVDVTEQALNQLRYWERKRAPYDPLPEWLPEVA